MSKEVAEALLSIEVGITCAVVWRERQQSDSAPYNEHASDLCPSRQSILILALQYLDVWCYNV